jgi:hypothetical protein
VIDFGLLDMVPHIAARKTHHWHLEFSFDAPKRLLQAIDLPYQVIRRNHLVGSRLAESGARQAVASL